VRAAALTAMARSSVPSARVRNAITGALEDPDARVRAAAVRATRSSNVSQPVRETQLLSALQDPDEDVRAAAVNVLCHDTNSLENLESDITSLLHAENDSIAWNAAFLISRSGSEAVPRLLKTAHDPGSRMHHLAKAISITAGHSHSMLYEATRDDNARVRQVALLALGQIRPVSRETTDIVIASLETDDNDILLACLQSLHNLEQHANTAVPHVRKLKRHTSPRIRRQVIDILFTSAPQDEQLTTDLIELVEDPDVNVRCHAIGVLQAIGPRGALAIPAVLNHLQHDSPKLRMATVEFLASHGSAASPAVPLLRQELRSGDAEWRRAVIGALGNIGTAAQSAYQDLIDALTDESPQVREASLRGLVQLEFPFERVKSPLLHALDDAEPGVRYQAARGLRRFGNEATVLIPQLIRRSRQEQYHEETVKLLERFERYEIDPVIIDPLIELTSADQVETQRMAIRFLGLAGPTAEKALPRLASLQTHSEPSLRNEAKAAVARISGSVDSADSD